MEDTYPIFEGTAEKIIIESEDSGYCPPAPRTRDKTKAHNEKKRECLAHTAFFRGLFSGSTHSRFQIYEKIPQ